MSSPIPSNIQERSRGLAPNIVQGGRIVSRTEVIKQQEQAKVDATIARQQAEARAKAELRAKQLATDRKRSNKKKQEKAKDQAQADQKAAEKQATFDLYKEAKAKAADQGVDIYGASFNIDRTDKGSKITLKGVKGASASKKAKQAAEKAAVKEATQDLYRQADAQANAQGVNLVGARFKTTKTPTGALKVELKGVTEDRRNISLSKKATAATDVIDTQSVAKDLEATARADAKSKGLRYKKGTAKRDADNISYEAYDPAEVSKLFKDQKEKDRRQIEEYERQGFVFVGKKKTDQGYELEFAQLTDEASKPDIFKPDLGQQIYRGTVVKGGEFIAGVGDVFNYVPGVSEKQKLQGAENKRQFLEAIGSDKNNPVYGGFGGLIAGTGAAAGSAEAQAELAAAKKAMQDRPVEFAISSVVDVGSGLIGAKGLSKGTLPAVGSTIKGVAVSGASKVTKAISGISLKDKTLSLTAKAEKPPKWQQEYNAAYPAKAGAKLTEPGFFKTSQVPQIASDIKQVSSKVKQVPKAKFDLPKANFGKSTAQEYEAFKPLKLTKFKPIGESSEPSVGTRVEPKPTKINPVKPADVFTPGKGSQVLETVKRTKTPTVQQPKTTPGIDQNLANTLKKQLDYQKLKANLGQRLEPFITPRLKKKQAPAKITTPKYVNPTEYKPTKTEERIFKPSKFTRGYKLPGIALGLGGATGAELVKKRRKDTQFLTEIESLRVPGEKLGLDTNTSLRINEIIGVGKKAGTSNFDLSKELSKTISGAKLRNTSGARTGFDLSQGLSSSIKLEQSTLFNLKGLSLGKSITMPGEQLTGRIFGGGGSRIIREKTPKIPRLKFELAGGYRKGGRRTTVTKRKTTKRQFAVKSLIDASLGSNSNFAKQFERQFGELY